MAAQHDSGHQGVAEQLREQPPKLDDVGRARMERHLLEQIEAQSQDVPAPARRRTARIAVGGALAGALAAAAVTLAVVGGGGAGEGAQVAGDPTSTDTRAAPEATFERVERGEAVERGAVTEGDELRTGTSERTRVRVGAASRIELAPAGRAAVERLAAEEVRVRLSEGSVFVEFHPDRRGEQRMAVETSLARVEVVGTVFRVAVEDNGATRVSVEEGTVRVVPHAGGRARLVRSGEQTRVIERTATGGGGEVERGEAEASKAEASEAEAVGRVPALPGGTVARADAAVASASDGGTGADVASEAEVDRPDSWRRPLASNVRFELAEVLMDRGRYAKARHELFAIARRAKMRDEGARAWNMVAESWMAQRRWAEAADAYRRAADRGRGTLEGANGLYALARLRELRLDDAGAARAAYRRYRRDYPDGVHREAVGRALCRLGNWQACR